MGWHPTYFDKTYSKKDREANIAFGTSFNGSSENPLAQKAREIRKANPGIDRDKAFNQAEKDLQSQGYKPRNW